MTIIEQIVARELDAVIVYESPDVIAFADRSVNEEKGTGIADRQRGKPSTTRSSVFMCDAYKPDKSANTR
ncbi:hypothetical protein BCT27_08280 [Enterovibrio norvegicus]|nr:hypothetical protein BCT27_08280 [Enterovibrio norvegicus]